MADPVKVIAREVMALSDDIQSLLTADAKREIRIKEWRRFLVRLNTVVKVNERQN